MGVVVVIVAIAGFILIRSNGGSEALGSWYYDLGTGELFVGPDSAIAPIEAESGVNQGVRAYIYTCGDCSSEQRKLIYLSKMTEEAKQALSTSIAQPGVESEATRIVDEGERVAMPPQNPGAPVTWVAATSPQGRSIMAALRTMCNGSIGKPCLP